jgi:UDP-N-acetylmuramoylalanine--D-glutamate ligase
MDIRQAGVIGAGRSGVAAAAFLKKLGARVLLSDAGKIHIKVPKGIELEQGGHTERLLKSDLLVRSPGVPNSLPILRAALRRHIPLWSELELASRDLHPRELIAITGTNGKTTTTTLTGQIFKAANRPTLVGGNIGTPLSDLASRVTRKSTVVLEVSSYQLENIDRFHPTIAAILNVTPDHLEHHGTLRAYAAAKARLFENQRRTDVCVLNADDACCRRLSHRCAARVLWFSRQHPVRHGVYYHQGRLYVRWNTVRGDWMLKTNLPGPHNIENVLASVGIAIAAKVPVPVIRRVLETFRGVEHRLEKVRTLDGVRYVNDSKGTNVDSTRVALESFLNPLIVIMGGEGKGSPYDPLKPLVETRAKRLLLIGDDAARIRRALGSVVKTELLHSMPRAVRRARRIAQPGDVVLLSPACASFDQYRNYEERGRHFKALVKALR